MWPLVLLFLFLALALAAIIFFAVLTVRDKESWRDDWKRFLGSFAGTALALSVGFISLLLQQQAHDHELRNEEASKIRAGLLYSIVQKKSLLSLLDDVSSVVDFHKACDENVSLVDRQKAFRESGAEDVPEAKINDAREMYKQAFGSPSFQVGALQDVFKTTNFSSLIDQRIASDLSELELEVIFGGSRKLITMTNPETFRSRENFCNAIRGATEIKRDGEKLQIYTCVAYAALASDVSNSLMATSRWASLTPQIVTRDSPTEKRTKFLENTQISLSAGIKDFRYCLGVAGMKF